MLLYYLHISGFAHLSSGTMFPEVYVRYSSEQEYMERDIECSKLVQVKD